MIFKDLFVFVITGIITNGSTILPQNLLSNSINMLQLKQDSNSINSSNNLLRLNKNLSNEQLILQLKQESFNKKNSDLIYKVSGLSNLSSDDATSNKAESFLNTEIQDNHSFVLEDLVQNSENDLNDGKIEVSAADLEAIEYNIKSSNNSSSHEAQKASFSQENSQNFSVDQLLSDLSSGQLKFNVKTFLNLDENSKESDESQLKMNNLIDKQNLITSLSGSNGNEELTITIPENIDLVHNSKDENMIEIPIEQQIDFSSLTTNLTSLISGSELAKSTSDNIDKIDATEEGKTEQIEFIKPVEPLTKQSKVKTKPRFKLVERANSQPKKKQKRKSKYEKITENKSKILEESLQANNIIEGISDFSENAQGPLPDNADVEMAEDESIYDIVMTFRCKLCSKVFMEKKILFEHYNDVHKKVT